MANSEMRREWIDDRPYMGGSLVQRSRAVCDMFLLTVPEVFGGMVQLLLARNAHRLADVLVPGPSCDHGDNTEEKVACTLRHQANTLRSIAAVFGAAADVLDPKAVEP